jgi:hypothetical protein
LVSRAWPITVGITRSPSRPSRHVVPDHSSVLR